MSDEMDVRDLVDPAERPMPTDVFFRALETRRTRALVDRDMPTLEARSRLPLPAADIDVEGTTCPSPN